MPLKKSRKAYTDGYKWGHQTRYDEDEEYRENCIKQRIPRILMLKTSGHADMDADQKVFEALREEGKR